MKLLITYNDLHNRILADTQELFQSYKPSHSLKSLFLYQFSPAEKQVKYVSVFLLACASYGLQLIKKKHFITDKYITYQ